MRSMHLKHGLTTAALATGITLISADRAYAYLDPGTASLLLQGIIGAIAAGLVVIKLYWQRLKALFGLGRADNQSSSAVTGPDRSDP
jgi:hypothetical protein